MIKVDLYHEARLRQTQRERDPVKLAIALSGLIAAGCLGYFFWALNDLRVLSHTCSNATQKLSHVHPAAERASKQLAETAALQASAQRLMELAEQRWYAAPLLGQLAKVQPDGLRLTRLTMTGASGLRTVSVAGVATSDDPRAMADAYRQALAAAPCFDAAYQATSKFKVLEDLPTEGSTKVSKFIIELGVSKPAPSPKPKSKATAAIEPKI